MKLKVGILIKVDRELGLGKHFWKVAEEVFEMKQFTKIEYKCQKWSKNLNE